MRTILFAFLVLILGCNQQQVKEPLPAPTIISVPTKIYVPIPDLYLVLCKWRETAPPSLALEIARERKACLKRYEAQLKSIGNIREKPVEETASGK